MSEKVVVAGIGMTKFGKHLDRTVRTLAEEAVKEALADAGIEAKDVQTCFFANAVSGLMTGQEMIRGQAALRYTGLLGIPIFNVENACASAASAFHLAWMSVASGQYDIALAVGSEKLTHEDKTRAFKAIGTAVDLESLVELQKTLDATKSKDQQQAADKGAGQNRSFFMDVYASMTREYMKSSGATAADFADVAVKSHDHGALNPKAQYRDRVTREEVLNADRRRLGRGGDHVGEDGEAARRPAAGDDPRLGTRLRPRPRAERARRRRARREARLRGRRHREPEGRAGDRGPRRGLAGRAHRLRGPEPLRSR
jgi:acetyl-CoA acetyltransferase